MATLINLLGLTLVIIILIVIMYVIHSLNKRLKEKIEIEKERIKIFYQRYENINKNNPTKKDLDELDKLARDLFKEEDGMDYKLSYIELAKKYKDNNQTTKYNFCSQMSKIMYSEYSLTKAEIGETINSFNKIIEEYKFTKIN